MKALPLSGIKVLELAQNLAGPFAGETLARLGADVVKVERPEGGDDARGWGPPFLEYVKMDNPYDGEDFIMDEVD